MMSKFTGKQQQGFSIVEVMVSLFVLAAGMLGVTQLQSSSLQNASKSISRSQAAYLGYEILDRVRANPGQLYTIAAGEINAAKDCFASACSASELKGFDLTEWKCNFTQYRSTEACAPFLTSALSTANSLTAYVDGDGTVVCQMVSGQKQCAVTISWQEGSRGQDTPQSHNFSLVVVL